MNAFFQDIRYAARSLRQNPGFAAIAVATLALGIGANTAVFSLTRGVLLRPLPYRDADRLLFAGLSLPDFRDIRESCRSFDGMAVFASNRYNLARGDDSEQVLGGVVSPDFFPLLAPPRLGRAFGASEEHERVVVLSDRFWRSRFGADPSVLGRAMDIGGAPYTILGVAGPEFEFPTSEFALWVPLAAALDGTPAQWNNRSLRIFRTVAHLKPGVRLEAALAQVRAVSLRLQKEYPDSNAGVAVAFEPLREALLGRIRPALLVLLAAVSLILLIACANVANLTLARVSAREREIAIRSALGAGRARLIRQILTESVFLSAVGGALGLAAAAWGVSILPRLTPGDVPRLGAVRVDSAVLLFTFSVAVATGILFGLAPALSASRSSLAERLKESGRGTTGGARTRRFRHGLVVAEVAFSVVVMVGAGLLLRSFQKLLSVPAGFEASHLLTFNLDLSDEKSPARRAALARAVLDRLSLLPGVAAAGSGTGLPPETPQRGTGFAVAGRPIDNPEDARAYFLAVSPDYFRALGTAVREGRVFNDADRDGGPPVVIVSRGLARKIFPSGGAVGSSLKLVNPDWPGQWRTIVGVVDDVRYSGLDDPGRAAIYTPFEQTPFPWSYVLLRTSVPPEGLADSVRSRVHAVAPGLVAANIRPMERIVSSSVARPRFQALLLSGFALLALLLSSIGISGVISQEVARRTGEIGIRVALGARSSDVLRMIAGHGFRLVLLGLAAGVIAALGATRVLGTLLFEVGATDPLTFLSIGAVLAAVGLLASLLPARKALRVDPMVALRNE